MPTRRAMERRVKECLANAGVSPQVNQLPPQDKQVAPQVQAPVVSPPMRN